MTRTYHRTQSTSAPPSRANWEPNSPRDCTGCGRRLRITKDSIFFRMWPRPQSFCSDCMPKWALVRAAAVHHE